MRTERVQKSLRSVERRGELVKVERPRGWDDLDGVVVATGPKWLVLAVEYDAGFYGHSILRTRDIKKIRTNPPSFVPRALEREGNWPMPCLDAVDVRGSTRTLAASLSGTDLLVAVHYEASHPGECLVGVVRRAGGRKVTLRTIDTQARWDQGVFKFTYGEITRLDIGGPYLNRLRKAGDTCRSAADD